MSTDRSYGYTYSEPDRTEHAVLNWPAIISLATAIAGGLTIVAFSLPISAFAIVMGHVGLRHASRVGAGRGQAIGGLVVGYFSAVATIIFIAVTMANIAYALAQIQQALQNLPTYP